jgi:hypothetical protein
MARLHVRHAATLLALLGVGLAMGAPFILGAHAVLARLRSVSLQIFAMLAASAVFSAAANAGKLHLMQTALGLKLRFARTHAHAPGSRLPAPGSQFDFNSRGGSRPSSRCIARLPDPYREPRTTRMIDPQRE